MSKRRVLLSSRINPGFPSLFFTPRAFHSRDNNNGESPLPFQIFLLRDFRALHPSVLSRCLPLDFASLRGLQRATPMSLHCSLSRSSTRTASAPFSYIYAHSTALGSRPAYTFLLGGARRGSPKSGERLPTRGSTTTSSDRSRRGVENLFSTGATHRLDDDNGTRRHSTRSPRTICRRHDASDAWRRDAHPRSRPVRDAARRRERVQTL